MFSHVSFTTARSSPKAMWKWAIKMIRQLTRVSPCCIIFSANLTPSCVRGSLGYRSPRRRPLPGPLDTEANTKTFPGIVNRRCCHASARALVGGTPPVAQVTPEGLLAQPSG